MAPSIPAWGTSEWVEWYTAAYGFPPVSGGSPEDDDDDSNDADRTDDDGGDDDADKDDDAPPNPEDRTEPDWKREARKHERRAKKEREEAEKLRRQLKEREDQDKSEQEKALDAAREEARREALTEAEKERRNDRLEVAVTRLAAKGVTVGDGDDAKTVKFADAEDALLHVQRGDVEDMFDDEGKVQTDALEEALADLVQRKPHLAAGEGKPSGSADTRRGAPADKDLEGMSPEDHAKRKYGTQK